MGVSKPHPFVSGRLHAHKPINANENKSAQNISSLSLAGWAPVVTDAEEVRWPLAVAQLAVSQSLLQWQFFDHMGTFYEETTPPKVGFSPLEGGHESCSLASYQALAFFSAVLGGVSLQRHGPVAQGGRSRPFPS